MKDVPPNLMRARELAQLIQEDLSRLQTTRSVHDPAVPSLAAHVDELSKLINSLPPASDAPADKEVSSEMWWISKHILADAAWWVVKMLLES